MNIGFLHLARLGIVKTIVEIEAVFLVIDVQSKRIVGLIATPVVVLHHAKPFTLTDLVFLVHAAQQRDGILIIFAIAGNYSGYWHVKSPVWLALPIV
ncbi:hypothetical protein D3C75_966690 [compost metagenome]